MEHFIVNMPSDGMGKIVNALIPMDLSLAENPCVGSSILPSTTNLKLTTETLDIKPVTGAQVVSVFSFPGGILSFTIRPFDNNVLPFRQYLCKFSGLSENVSVVVIDKQ